MGMKAARTSTARDRNLGCTQSLHTLQKKASLGLAAQGWVWTAGAGILSAVAQGSSCGFPLPWGPSALLCPLLVKWAYIFYVVNNAPNTFSRSSPILIVNVVLSTFQIPTRLAPPSLPSDLHITRYCFLFSLPPFSLSSFSYFNYILFHFSLYPFLLCYCKLFHITH